MIQGDKELDGKVAIVTGSSSNIGRAIALEFADGAATVVVNAMTSATAAAEVGREVESRGGRALVHMADVTDPSAVEELVDNTIQTFGKLDIMVCNVGYRFNGSLSETSLEDFNKVLSGTVGATFLCAKSALLHLQQSDAGAIISIGGVSGHAGVVDRIAVCAGKAGVAGMTRALAAELAPNNITVNCVSPGYIETVDRTFLPKHFRKIPVPLGRPGQPSEIAAMVRMLCGPGGRFITGQVIHVNGGWYM